MESTFGRHRTGRESITVVDAGAIRNRRAIVPSCREGSGKVGDCMVRRTPQKETTNGCEMDIPVIRTIPNDSRKCAG